MLSASRERPHDQAFMKSILIVDDDEPTRRLLDALMRRNGHATIIAENGRAALDILRQRTVDVVILDLMMPEVSGTEVVTQLEATDDPPSVVVCTAAGRRGTPVFSSKVVKAIVQKPFDIAQLIRVVDELAPPLSLIHI